MFANAADLLRSSGIDLINENGSTTPLKIRTKEECSKFGIQSARIDAVPMPDGNSEAVLTINYGNDYDAEIDGSPQPLVLVGNQVYGLRESPFAVVDASDEFCSSLPNEAWTGRGDYVCRFGFVGATELLRTSRSFTIADMRWQIAATGDIHLEPSFTSLKALDAPTSPSKPPDKPCPNAVKRGKKTAKPQPCTAAPAGASSVEAQKEPTFVLTGWNFDDIKPALASDNTECVGDGCLKVFDGWKEVTLDKDHYQRRSSSIAILKLHGPANSNALRVLWQSPTNRKTIEWDLGIPKTTSQAITASPSVINVGDSLQIAFTGVDPDKVAGVYFEGGPKLYSTWNADKSKLTVQVTTDITKTAGHKELTGLDSTGKIVTPLPFDVSRR
ncbi:MAG: hypothetical protein JOZ62_23160 [Acidobacteriaceae bacterium]|nr:hypothetical protein [Acidobacteriaceae bacterium]